MTRFTALVLSTTSLIAFGLAAPTTYDQRQDGELNFSGKLENFLIVIASPSNEPSMSSVEDSELAAYLTLLGGRKPSAGTTTRLYQDSDDGDKDVDPKAPESSSADEVPRERETPTDDAKKARSLWGRVEEVVDNKEGRTLKKELSWGQDQAHDEGGRSSDHNEVGLIQDGRFTLLGDGIEDCGPERRRDSYGICQPYSEE